MYAVHVRQCKHRFSVMIIMICRSQSMGIASVTGRIGNLIAPFTSLMVVISLYRTVVISYGLIAIDGQMANQISV